MKRLGLLILLFIIPAVNQAQNTDSLFNSLVDLMSPPKGGKRIIASGDAQKYKCAFGLITDVKLNFDKFTSYQKSVASALLATPASDTSIVSPSGFFRIHFSASGDNKPAYSVDELALAADSVYAFEVGTLGFAEPPQDGTFGGDSKYDIYIRDIADYGWTTLQDYASNGYYTTYMEIDNDFTDDQYYVKGINAARVTLAHEFHHAIQLGNYPYRSDDLYYNEITSTSMEEFFYSGINDYLNYLVYFFEYSDETISSHDGYDLAILNIYLKERFGISIIKKIWDNITSYRALKAISLTLEGYSASFKTEYANFCTWAFFTGYRAVDGQYFEDAKLFPVFTPSITLNYLGAEKMASVNTEPVSCAPVLFVNTSITPADSIYACIVNADYLNGYENTSNTAQCSYYLSPSNSSGAKKISSSYYVKLTSGSSDVIKDFTVLNNELTGEGETVVSEEISDPFPQPFNYSKHSTVAIPAPKGDSEQSLLYIFTANMRQVFSGALEVIENEKIFVRWNGYDSGNNKLPNGVYFYITKRDDSILKGKLIIQNE